MEIYRYILSTGQLLLRPSKRLYNDGVRALDR